MLDFMDNLSNATFVGSDGMGDDIASVSIRQVCSRFGHCIGSPPMGLLRKQMVTSGRSGEKRRTVTEVTSVTLLWRPASV